MSLPARVLRLPYLTFASSNTRVAPPKGAHGAGAPANTPATRPTTSAAADADASASLRENVSSPTKFIQERLQRPSAADDDLRPPGAPARGPAERKRPLSGGLRLPGTGPSPNPSPNQVRRTRDGVLRLNLDVLLYLDLTMSELGHQVRTRHVHATRHMAHATWHTPHGTCHDAHHTHATHTPRTRHAHATHTPRRLPRLRWR